MHMKIPKGEGEGDGGVFLLKEIRQGVEGSNNQISARGRLKCIDPYCISFREIKFRVKP